MSELFRKKSIERVTLPEQLNDYIRVSNPGVWMILAAVVILLAGVCVWGVFGRLDTKKQASGVCENGKLTCYIKSDDISDVKEDTIISVDGKEYTVKSVSASPVKLDGEKDSYLIYLGGFSETDWVYVATVDSPDLADGEYSVDVITKRVSPISFVLN